MIFKILICAGIVALFVAIVISFIAGWKCYEFAVTLCGWIWSVLAFMAYFAMLEIIHQILYGSYIT